MNEAQAVAYVWWPWLLVQAVYHIVALTLYVARRRHRPIRKMRPTMSIFANLFASGFAMGICLTSIGRDRLSMFTSVIIIQSFLSLTTDMHTLIAWDVFLVLYKTQDQLILAKADPAQVEHAQGSIRLSKCLLGGKAKVAFVTTSLAVQLIAQTIYAIGHPDIFDRDDLNVETPAKETFLAIGIIKHIVSVAIDVTLAWRLRIVIDPHGMKRQLRRIALGGLVGWIVFLGTKLTSDATRKGPQSFKLENFVGSCIADYVITVAITIPMLQTFRTRAAVESDGTNSHDLERFLRTTLGFDLFKTRLAREFAIENIMFWRDCDVFRRYSGDDRERGAKAMRIYRQYLEPNAPLEVNLPDSMSSAFRYQFGRYTRRGCIDTTPPSATPMQTTTGPPPGNLPVVRPDQFAGASDAILSLMESNFFERFKADHQLEWKAFQREYGEE